MKELRCAVTVNSQSASLSNLAYRNVVMTAKKIMGRKCQVVVDTLELPMTVVAHPANIQESVAAKGGLKEIEGEVSKGNLEHLCGRRPQGKPAEGMEGVTLRTGRGNCQKEGGGHLQGTAQKMDSRKDFFFDILSDKNVKNYERPTDSSVAFTQLSMVRFMLDKFQNSLLLEQIKSSYYHMLLSVQISKMDHGINFLCKIKSFTIVKKKLYSISLL